MKILIVISSLIILVVSLYFAYYSGSKLEGMTTPASSVMVPFFPILNSSNYKLYLNNKIEYYYNIDITDSNFLDKVSYSFNNSIIFCIKVIDDINNIIKRSSPKIDINNIDPDVLKTLNNMVDSANNNNLSVSLNDPFVTQIMSDVQQQNYTRTNTLVNNLCKNINFNDINNEIHCICLRIILLNITLMNAQVYTTSSSSHVDPIEKSEFNYALSNISSSISKILQQKIDPLQIYKLNVNPVINFNGKPVTFKDATLNLNTYFGIIFVKILYDLINANIIIDVKLDSNHNIDFMDLYKKLFSTYGNGKTLIKINQNHLTKYMKSINYTNYMKNYV